MEYGEETVTTIDRSRSPRKARWALLRAACAISAFLLITLFQVELLRHLRLLAIPTTRTTVASLGNGMQPISLDTHPGDFLRLQLQFRINDTLDWPNLFQTAFGNAGLRAELSNDALSLLIPPQGTEPLSGSILADHLNLNTWYTFTLEAVNADFVAAHVDGYPGYRSWLTHPSFDTSAPRVGIGFDNVRRFHGDIRNIVIEHGAARSATFANCILYTIKIALLAIFFFAIRSGFANDPLPELNATAVPPRHPYDPLLTLRFIACLMVVLGHGFLINFRPDNLPAALDHGRWLLTASPWAGVWIFFTLSGYLMGKGFFSGRYQTTVASIGDFYRNRLLRIAPIYFTAILLVAALQHPEAFRPENLGTLFVMSIFDFDGELTNNLVGPALWSISTEMQFYLLVPLLFVAFGTRLRSWGTASATLATLLIFGLLFRTLTLQWHWDLWPREVYKPLLSNIDLFFCGFMLNHLTTFAARRNIRLRYGIVSGLLLSAALFVGSAYISSQAMILNLPAWHAFLFMVLPTCVTILTATIIFCFEFGEQVPRSRSIAFLKKTEILGTLTYAYYIWHAPIFISLAQNDSGPRSWLHSIVAFSASCFITLLISLIMYSFIEQAFDKRRKYGSSARKQTIETLVETSPAKSAPHECTSIRSPAQ
jgi:peptidoglycan/LPS O-acetylase OafA/YrhL